MSTQRDELAELIATAEYPNLDPPWAERKDRSPVKWYSRKYADVLIAAGYRKPRTIRTVEELDALDADSVLRTKHGTLYTKGRDRDVLLSGVGWFTISDAIAEEQSFTVLYEPQP